MFFNSGFTIVDIYVYIINIQRNNLTLARQIRTIRRRNSKKAKNYFFFKFLFLFLLFCLAK